MHEQTSIITNTAQMLNISVLIEILYKFECKKKSFLDFYLHIKIIIIISCLFQKPDSKNCGHLISKQISHLIISPVKLTHTIKQTSNLIFTDNVSTSLAKHLKVALNTTSRYITSLSLQRSHSNNVGWNALLSSSV